jgi:hypothetical protein
MARIIIIGAGMAGLLAANMLRRHELSVIERQSSLPNNHHAVLRFRSEAVSQQLHIPFRKVRVFKSCDEADPIKAAIHYAKKVTGRYEVRSLIDLAPCDRFIAPPDLVQQMAHGIRPAFDVEWDFNSPWSDPIISTVPMEALMDILEYPGERPKFVSVPGWTVTATIQDCDMFVTRYITRSDRYPYRVSITGDQLIAEGVGDTAPSDPNTEALKAACTLGINASHLGPATSHASRYAKIGHLSSADRRKAQQFMFWATTQHNIYSLGRFATWRAGLLLDDLVPDIIKIERWMTGSKYDIKRSL